MAFINTMKRLRDRSPVSCSPQNHPMETFTEVSILHMPPISLGHMELPPLGHPLCTHEEKLRYMNSSLSLQNTLLHTSESCAFALTTVASQFLYLCGFLFSVLWHLKPKADFNLELDFTKFSIFDGSLVRPLKPQRCISGKGALWMGRQCWEQCWLICMAHSESELSLSMEIRKHSVNQDTTYWMREEGAPLGHHREYGWNLTWCQIPYNTNWGAHQLAVYVNSSLT